MNVDPSTESPDRDGITEALRQLRPAPSRLDSSTVFYQAGFHAGQAQEPVRSFRLTHLVAAGLVAALLSASIAVPTGYRVGQASIARPMIMPNVNGDRDEMEPATSLGGMRDGRLADDHSFDAGRMQMEPTTMGIVLDGDADASQRRRPETSANGSPELPLEFAHSNGGPLHGGQSNADQSGDPLPVEPTLPASIRSRLFAYWTGPGATIPRQPRVALATTSLTVRHRRVSHGEMSDDSWPGTSWSGFLAQDEALLHRDPWVTPDDKTDSSPLKMLTVGDVRELAHQTMEVVR